MGEEPGAEAPGTFQSASRSSYCGRFLYGASLPFPAPAGALSAWVSAPPRVGLGGQTGRWRKGRSRSEAAALGPWRAPSRARARGRRSGMAVPALRWFRAPRWRPPRGRGAQAGSAGGPPGDGARAAATLRRRGRRCLEADRGRCALMGRGLDPSSRRGSGRRVLAPAVWGLHSSRGARLGGEFPGGGALSVHPTLPPVLSSPVFAQVGHPRRWERLGHGGGGTRGSWGAIRGRVPWGKLTGGLLKQGPAASLPPPPV